MRLPCALVAVLMVLGSGPGDALGQVGAPAKRRNLKLRPFKRSLQRREKLMGVRERLLRGKRFGAMGIRGRRLQRQKQAAERLRRARARARRKARRPAPPPPATLAAKKGEDKSLPKKERHLSPWPRYRRGRIDFDKADIRDVAKFISEITGQNIILSDKARGGKLTIYSPRPVSRGEAYRAFLAALEVNNLTVVRSGRFLKIVPQRDAKTMPTGVYFRGSRVPRDERMVTVILQVRHGDAKNINNVITQLRNKNGFNLVYAPSNSIIIADVASNVRRLIRIVRKLDVAVGSEDRVYVIRIEHATASDIVEKVNKVFGEKKGNTARTPVRRTPVYRGKRVKYRPYVVGAATSPDDFTVSKILADDRTNQIILVASESSYLRVLALIGRIDIKLPHDEGRVHVYNLENADAEQLAGVLSNLVSGAASSRGRTSSTRRRPGVRTPTRTSSSSASGVLFQGEVKVSADKATNSLVIVASPKDFERLKRVIRRLDTRRRQVFVEAVIMEVSMTKTRNLGLAFSGGTSVEVSGNQVPIFGGTTFGSLSSLVLDPTTLTGLAVGVRGPEIAGTSGLLGGVGLSLPSFSVILRALQSTSDVNVLSTPHILASDNEEAEIVVGQNVPFITGGGYGGAAASQLGALGGAAGTALSGLGGIGGALGTLGIGGFPNIQRQDVALTLKITPQVNASNFVKLKVEQEVQDLAGDDPLRGPTTTKRRVKTTVIIKDQQTVVLGGLIRDNYTEDINKVPLLGDIPIIGYFFRDTVKRVEKRNLLLFLTPYIIKDPSDFRRIFKRKMKERQRFVEMFASRAKGWRSHIDYSKRHGLLEEINQTVQEVQSREAAEAKAVETAKKQRLKDRDLLFVRGEEIRPSTPEKRRNLDETLSPTPMKQAPPAGKGAPPSAGAPGAVGKTKAPAKKRRDPDGVRDE